MGASVQKMKGCQNKKAIDLSAFYKDKILKPFQAIYYVYLNSGVLEILDKMKQDDMTVFDTVEMEQLLGKSNINKLKKIQYSEKFCKSVLEANNIYNLNLHIQQRKTEDTTTKNLKIEINVDSLLASFMSGIVINMLNDLEFFAMHFTHNSADESVVFQSLHQTYIQIVKNLYYNISKTNIAYEGKYYTNIIELYEIWYERSEGQKKQARNSPRHNTSKGTTINKNN